MADTVSNVTIAEPEKRRDEGGKYYAYRVEVRFASGRSALVWRRYSQFDALHDTVAGVLRAAKSAVALPRLTSKRYLARSAVRAVAEHRLPKLQRFLVELLSLAEQPSPSQVILARTLLLFLTPTAADQARAAAHAAAAAAAGGGVSDAAQGLPGPAAAAPFAPGGVFSALYDYAPQYNDELPLRAGAAVTVVARVTDEWLRVRTADATLVTGDGAAEGLVPALYLDPAPRRPRLASPAEELLATERTHVAMLEEVRDDFYPKLRHCVTAAEAKTLFGHWAALVPASRALLAALEQGLGPAAALAAELPRLAGPYARYCAGVPAAQTLYDRKLAERPFAAFEASMPALNKPTLNYLLRPVQVCLR